MPIRNPFARRPGVIITDENSRPGTPGDSPAHPGFERVDTVGSKASSAISVRSGSRRSQDTGEYKMSVVNDSGVYLPPSPIETEATWPRRYLSRASSDAKSTSGTTTSGDIEHFSISRESFDSYRRSFDICAKSPIAVVDPVPARQSLDSARFPRLPRSTLGERQRFPQAPPTPEESFEEVGLNDESNKQQQQQPSQPQQPPPAKKKGFFFAKFGSDSTTTNTTGSDGAPNSQTMSRFLPGRKRGQSGQGAELGAMPVTTLTGTDRPGTANSSSLVEQEVQS